MTSLEGAVGGSSEQVAYLDIDANQRVEPFLTDPYGAGYFGAGDLPTIPAVSVVERIGPVDEEHMIVLDDYINILGADQHSTDTFDGFVQAPITGTHSVERWLQIRVQPPFNSFAGLRVWIEVVTVDGYLANMAPGWTVKFGHASDYAEPSSALSTIATTALPLFDPGVDTPNLMTAPLVDGVIDEVSLWLVLQIVVDPAHAGPQPVGYATETWTPAPFRLRFAWTET